MEEQELWWNGDTTFMFTLRNDQSILLQKEWKVDPCFYTWPDLFQPSQGDFADPWWYSDCKLWQHYLLSAMRRSSAEELLCCTQYSVAKALLLAFPRVGRALSLWYCQGVSSFNVCRPRSCFPFPCSSSASEKAHPFLQGLQLCKKFPGSLVTVYSNALRGDLSPGALGWFLRGGKDEIFFLLFFFSSRVT